MASKVAFVKQSTNWIAFVPRIIILGLLCIFFYQLDKKIYFIPAFIVYLLITYLFKILFLPEVLHKGIQFIREAKFGKAIPLIHQSIAYYVKYPWIDKYRYLFMISSSTYTLREMCLCNYAYCSLQIGEITKATQIYEDILKEFPNNINASSMLNTINILSPKSNFN